MPYIRTPIPDRPDADPATVVHHPDHAFTCCRFATADSLIAVDDAAFEAAMDAEPRTACSFCSSARTLAERRNYWLGVHAECPRPCAKPGTDQCYCTTPDGWAARRAEGRQ